jgi:DNA-binding LacI/PurR family transcriptional regulator
MTYERTVKNRRINVGRNAMSVSTRLRELAVAIGPGNKLPTMDDLCEVLGTSRATLNNALRDLEAKHVVLRKRGSGIYVSPKVGYKSIAVSSSNIVVDRDLASPFWGILQDLLWRRAMERAPVLGHDYSFHLIPYDVPVGTSNARKSFDDLIASGNLDGVICVHPDRPLQDLLKPLAIPVVGYAFGPETGYGISYDHKQMFLLAAGQLIEQGCRRIMLMPSRGVHWKTYDELVTMCAQWDPRIELYSPDWREGLIGLPRIHQDLGHQVAREIFGARHAAPPDGLIVMDDMITDGIMKALCDLNVRAGRDVRIATQGNAGSPILRCWEDRLTIIESDPARLVESMFETLDAILAGDQIARGNRNLPWEIRVHGQIVRDK